MVTVRETVLCWLVVALLVAPVGATPAVATPTRGGANAGTPATFVAAASTGPADALARAGRQSTAATGEAETLRLVSRLQLTPSRPGELTVTMWYARPDSVTGIETRLPEESEVTEARGFTRNSDGWYVWDGRTEDAAITYRLPANETVAESGATVSSGATAAATASSGLLFADPGPWALVRLPAVTTRYSGRGDAPAFAESWRVDGPGAVGQDVAFLGEHETIRREAHGQTFRLVVPAAADLADPPAAVLSSLAAAAGALQVGVRDEQVFLVAAPTASVEWGVEGVSVGSADVWVTDDTPLADPDNTWIHEYVHTRQEYELAPDARWFTQASATYYAARLTFEQGWISYEEFRSFLAVGHKDPQGGAVLAAPATWANGAEYTKGALVAGVLDRRLRLAGGSLDAVFRRLNAREERIDGETFRSMLAREGNDSVAAVGRRYVTTDASPPTWTRQQHRQAFGALPAYVRTGAMASLRVRGPYGNRTVGGSRPVAVAAGETLVVETTLRNAGDSAGEYDVRFQVDDETVDRQTGAVPPDGRVTASFSRRFDASGTHTVSVTGRAPTAIGSVRSLETATVQLIVREPARPRVTSLEPNRTAVSAGESVSLLATVRNEEAVPGRVTVAFLDGEQTVAERTLVVDAGETRTVSASVTLETAGRHELRVAGGPSVTVRVAPSSPTPSATPTQVPGFSAGVALVGTLALALLAAGRARRQN